MKAEILQHLEQCGLGLRRGTVELAEYHQQWKDGFDFLHKLIAERISSEMAIEHIGSTAIPGEIAKPILDIMIVFDRGYDFDPETLALERLGFTAKGEYGIPERHYFNFYSHDETTEYAHIHAFPRGHLVERHLKFRNALLASPAMAREYSELKRDLVRGGITRKEYPGAKTAFIEKVLG